MFVAQVVGKSMEPAIPDGAYCLFAASAECRTPFYRRRRESGQQFVASTVAAFCRGIQVHPLPRLAQRPQHPIADPLHQLLHVGEQTSTTGANSRSVSATRCR